MSASIPILMYHQVAPRPVPSFEKYTVRPESFAAQMRWLALHGYRTIGLDDLLSGQEEARPSRRVLITFDDGYQDAVDHAVPILRERGLTAVFYLVAGLLGQTSRWLAERGIDLPLFDGRTARELEREGFACGVHGLAHRRLTELSSEACREELVGARRLLEDELGREVRDMAYPWGAYDERVRALVAEAGYRSACSVRVGLSGPQDDRFALHRVLVSGHDSLSDFVWRLRTGQTLRKYLRVKARSAWRHLRPGPGRRA